MTLFSVCNSLLLQAQLTAPTDSEEGLPVWIVATAVGALVAVIGVLWKAYIDSNKTKDTAIQELNNKLMATEGEKLQILKETNEEFKGLYKQAIESIGKAEGGLQMVQALTETMQTHIASLTQQIDRLEKLKH